MKRFLPLLLLVPGVAGADPAMLESVRAIHGAPGVFAVAGYRMGQRALRELHQSRGSFALEVVHHTPARVQYSCVADGLQAATGVSAGKLNLRVEPWEREETETIVSDRKSGARLTFRLRPEFLKRYLDTPREQQAEAAEQVSEMPEDEIFEVVR